MLEWIQALSPVISALIGVISYATLTNYRLDNLDSMVKPLHDKVNKLETRVSLLEEKIK